MVDAIESTSCAAEHSNNGGGQLREQECGLLIMWTGYYHSLVIGSQAVHLSHEVSPQHDCLCAGENRGSFAFYYLLKGDSLLVLLCRSCSRVLEAVLMGEFGSEAGKTVLRLGETTCFGRVLPPPPAAPPVFCSSLAVLGRSFFLVCVYKLF